MATCTVKYLSALRTEAVHLQSGSRIINDAPTDNHGKGEAFSPTDLTAVSLATCILTTIGIVASRENRPSIDGSTAEVTKVMYNDPRRIGEIHVDIRFAGNFTQKDRELYERTAHTCPVSRSLHPDIRQQITFSWP